MGVRIFILFHIWTCSYVAVHHSQMLGISSNECRFRSTRSISRFCKWIASSRIFFTFDIFLPETGKHWVWLMIRELFFKRLRRQYNSYDDVRGKIVIKYMMWTLRAKWELVEFFFLLIHSTSRKTNKYVVNWLFWNCIVLIAKSSSWCFAPLIISYSHCLHIISTLCRGVIYYLILFNIFVFGNVTLWRQQSSRFFNSPPLPFPLLPASHINKGWIQWKFPA